MEKGSLVLVTGVSGYIASHTADQLLEAGYQVRGSVRSLDKAKWIYELFDQKYGKGKFEAVVVPDMVAEDAFDDAVKGVSGICHVASVMTFSDKPDEVITPAVQGALNVLKAASKEAAVKSLVLTSSSTAALTPVPDKVIKVTLDTWNDEAVRQANIQPNSWNVYSASKTEAERALWKVTKETNPPFQVAAVLPNWNFGPILRPGGEMSSSTAAAACKLFNGDEGITGQVPPQWFIDVRDTARLHIVGLIDPSCNGKRIFAFAEPFNWNDVLGCLRKVYPDKIFPKDRELGRDLSDIPNGDAEALLMKHYGRGFISLQESVKANTATLA